MIQIEALSTIVSIAAGLTAFAIFVSINQDQLTRVSTINRDRSLSHIASFVIKQISKSKTFYHLANSIALRDKLLSHRFADPSYPTAMEMIAQAIQIKEAELLTYNERQAESLRDVYRYRFGLPTSKNTTK